MEMCYSLGEQFSPASFQWTVLDTHDGNENLQHGVR